MYYKTKLLIKIILVIIIFSIPNISKSACRDCTLRVGWEERQAVISVSGCPLTIKFKFGICNLTNDVKIELVGLTIPTGSTGATHEQFLEQASRFLLSATYFYSGYFSPAPSNFNVSLKVYNCYKLTPMGNYTIFDNICAAYLCCNEYNISFYGDTINTIYNSFPQPDKCQTGPIGDLQCKYSCDIIDEIEEGPGIYNPEGICLDTCDLLYSGGDQVTIVDGSCTFTVAYSKRLNCNGKKEYYISSIFTEGSCSSYDSSDEVINKAIKELLRNEASSSSENFIININKCFKEVEYGNIISWMTCEFYTCCSFEYIASKPSTNVVASNLGFLNQPFDDCDSISCIYICENNHFLVPRLFKPIILDENRPFTTFSNVIPNPTIGTTKFILDSPDIGLIGFQIFDNLGNIIMSMKTDKNSYHYEVSYDLNYLPNGKYFYNYENSGKQIFSGSFIINK